MGDPENRDVVERLFKAADAQDWTTMKDLYHPDAIEEWPQSNERLNGAANIMAVNENYQGHPGVQVKEVRAADNLVVGEAELDYGGTKYCLVSIFEFRDGKIQKEVDYFCEPFAAEEWRAQWVEKMTS
ncbi:MAG TPA: nuclear transport factor 2 family protein [Actinomycetota bacterium]|nr:nuclear transport factor 2 family protein [Actinomycetota bacterium]HVM35536.1 nuclear transport factor 2 family protein [Actinomycetota bacterium]